MSGSNVVLVAVDGSDLALDAARTGLALLAPDTPTAIVAVVEATDPTLVTGTGIASGVMSPEELQRVDDESVAEGDAAIAAAVTALGRAGAETILLRGDAGPELCDLAKTRGAAAIVMGTRGRGGIKRAFLGSVSDHVVRNAPCPVIVTRPDE
jgi:nucleotide-binding universal stress UspA family protein